MFSTVCTYLYMYTTCTCSCCSVELKHIFYQSYTCRAVPMLLLICELNRVHAKTCFFFLTVYVHVHVHIQYMYMYCTCTCIHVQYVYCTYILHVHCTCTIYVQCTQGFLQKFILVLKWVWYVGVGSYLILY